MRSTGLKLTALAFIALYLAACLYMFLVQRQLLFPADSRDVALDVGKVPGATVIELNTNDGEILKAWWVPPADEEQAVYLYFHGNAETLESRSERFTLLTAEGEGLLAVSWRGYGGSTGTPSEAGLHRDAVAAYEWLRNATGPARIIVFGESLGTGIAMWIASQYPAAALVLDSPYTAIYHIAQQRYPWLPVALLSRDPFDSEALAAAIEVPVLAFHCRDDQVVPYRMGQQLVAALATADKHLESIEGRCHVPSVEPLMPLFRDLEQQVRASEMHQVDAAAE